MLQIELSLFESLIVGKVLALHHKVHIRSASRGFVLSLDFELLGAFAVPRRFLELWKIVHGELWLFDVF